MSIPRDKYEALHRRIVEGLVRCNENEYLGRGEMPHQYQPPILPTLVRMLASSIVQIVMDWERETAPATDAMLAARPEREGKP